MMWGDLFEEKRLDKFCVSLDRKRLGTTSSKDVQKEQEEGDDKSH